MTSKGMNDNVYIFRKGDYLSVGELLMNKDSKSCEDCLLGMYVWKDRYDLRLIKAEDSSFVYSAAQDTFMMPVPRLTDKALEKMLEMSKRPMLVRVTEKNRETIERDYPGVFTFSEDPGSFDYIYDIGSLATLAGKKLSKKRNHVNGFISTYDDWHTEELSFKNLPKCRDFLKLWYADKLLRERPGASGSLLDEKRSMFSVLENYDYLEADGLVLFIGSTVAALTIGQRISSHTFDTVFEKADDSKRGAYNMINREFARFIMEKYPGIKYINRENDLGLEGLRHSKMSYRPSELLTKYTALYSGTCNK